MFSRSRSAWPLWRAYSSIMCTSIQRSVTRSPLRRGTTAWRSSPPSVRAISVCTRDASMASFQSWWRCSGVSWAAEFHSQSESAFQSTSAQGSAGGLPWSRTENQRSPSLRRDAWRVKRSVGDAVLRASPPRPRPVSLRRRPPPRSPPRYRRGRLVAPLLMPLQHRMRSPR